MRVHPYYRSLRPLTTRFLHLVARMGCADLMLQTLYAPESRPTFRLPWFSIYVGMLRWRLVGKNRRGQSVANNLYTQFVGHSPLRKRLV